MFVCLCQDAVNIYDHELTVNADSYLVKNSDLVPSGQPHAHV